MDLSFKRITYAGIKLEVTIVHVISLSTRMFMSNVMAFVLVVGIVMALSFLFVFLVVVVAISILFF